MTLIDGKNTAAEIKAEIAEKVRQMVANGGKQPHLAAVLVGHDGGSETYVKNKVLACEACGFKSTLIRFEDDITEEELLACVNQLNNDPDVDGFIVQLPLPKHIDEQRITEAIDPDKDVDVLDKLSMAAQGGLLPWHRCQQLSRRIQSLYKAEPSPLYCSGDGEGGGRLGTGGQ